MGIEAICRQGQQDSSKAEQEDGSIGWLDACCGLGVSACGRDALAELVDLLLRDADAAGLDGLVAGRFVQISGTQASVSQRGRAGQKVVP
jgi:hypothetical protein